MILGKGIAPFSKELAKETGKTLRQAQKLLSTELTRVQVQSSMQAMKDSGFDEFQLIANPNCCDECQKIDEKHYKIKDLASGENAPPMHPNCRCSIAAYVDDDTDDYFDEAAFDEWSETYDEHGLSWEEWQERKSNLSRGLLDSDTYEDHDYHFNEHNTLPNDEKVQSPKQMAVNYFKSKGISFIESSNPKQQVSAQWLKECAEWHQAFEDKFPAFANSDKYPKLKKIAAGASSVVKGALGAFVYNVKTHKPIGIFFDSTKFHTYKSIKNRGEKEYSIQEDGAREKSSNSPIRTFIHEYGHYVSNSLESRYGDGYPKEVLKEAICQYNTQYADENSKIVDLDDLRSAVSNYASKNEDEAFAELFADFFGNEEPSEIGKIFGNLLVKELSDGDF